MRKAAFNVLAGGKNHESNRLETNEENPRQLRKIKTNLEDIEMLCRHFPNFDEYFLHETSSLMESKKEEITAIKAAEGTPTGTDGNQRDDVMEKVFEMMMEDFEKHPDLKRAITLQWVEIRSDLVKARLAQEG